METSSFDNMETEEIIENMTEKHIIIKEIDPLQDTVELKLQKYLARIILDVKYDHNMTQTCVEIILHKFKQYFNDALDISTTQVFSMKLI